jgi:hypothetical protein
MTNKQQIIQLTKMIESLEKSIKVLSDMKHDARGTESYDAIQRAWDDMNFTYNQNMGLKQVLTNAINSLKK